MLTPKALSERLKNVLLNLISTQKTAYIKNRFIGEDGRLISDIANICDHNNIKYALLNNHESCVINGGITTQYFPLQPGAHQGDPTYLSLCVCFMFKNFIYPNQK